MSQRRRPLRRACSSACRRGSAALVPQVERAFSWASLVTIGPDNVARRFPPSDASRAAAAEERRLDELLRAAEPDFLALKFEDATARLDEVRARSSTGCLPRCGTRRRTCACSCCRGASRRRAAMRAPRTRSRAPARPRSTSSWTRRSIHPPSVRLTRRRARPCGPSPGSPSSRQRAGRRRDRGQRPARGTDAGEAVVAAGALLPVADARRLQAASGGLSRRVARR